MSRTRGYVIPGVILGVAVIMIAIILLTGSPGEDSVGRAPSGSGATTEPDGVVGEVVEPTLPERIEAERHDPDDPLAMGEVEAPVTIVMYSDFQCPFCALWTHQTLPELTGYIEDGDVRVEWRDLAVFGEDSRRAALAGYAAGLQGKYYEFTTALFSGGESPSPSELGDEALEDLAREQGLDVERFNADRAGEEVRAAVEHTFAEGEELGVFSTPAFLINGRPIIGAQPTETFIDAIESELAGAR